MFCFFTEPTIITATFAALSIGLVCVAIIVFIFAVCRHVHGKCFLHAVIISLTIMLHMLHCYSKENSRKQSYCIDVSFIKVWLCLYP